MAIIDAATVKIGAEISDLKSGLQKATSSVKEATDKMKGDLGGLSGSTAAISSAVGSSIAGLVSSIVVGIGAAVGALLSVTKGIEAVRQLGEESREISAVFGVNRDKAIAYAQAASDLNITQDELRRAATGLATQLKTNESGLNKMGLVTRDANGNQKEMNVLLQDAVQWVGTFSAGTARTEATMYAFGRGMRDVSKFTGYNNELIAEAEVKQQSLNLVLGQEGVEMIARYNLAQDDLGDVMNGIAVTVGKAVMPTFTAFLEWLSSFGPSAIAVVEGAFKGLMLVLESVGVLVYSVWKLIFGPLEAAQIAFQAIGNAAAELAQGNFSNAMKTMREGAGATAQKLVGTTFDIVNAWKNAGDRLNAIGKNTPLADPAGGGRNFNKPAGSSGGAGKERTESHMREYEAELKEMQAIYLENSRQNGMYLEMDLEQERRFWQEKLAAVKIGSNDYMAIKEKLNTLRRKELKDQYDLQMAELRLEEREAGRNEERKLEAIRKEKALIISKFGASSQEARAAVEREREAGIRTLQQKQDIENLKAKASRDRAMAEIAMEEEDARVQLDMGRITYARMFELEREFERRRYELKRAAAIAAREQIDPSTDPVEYQKRTATIEEIEREHQAKIGEIRRKEMRQQSEEEKEARRLSQQGFNQFFQDILSGQKSVKESFSDLLKFIEQEVLRLIAQQLSRQLTDSLFGGMGGGASGSGGGGGDWLSFVGNLFGAGSGMTGASGASSGAGGDIGTQIASGALTSFDVGTPFVPRDMIAMVHKGEAIIPAHRNHGGHVGGSTSIVNNFHLATPADPRTQTQIAHLAAQASARANRRNG